mgnify:CR=1 FL=1
MREGGGEFRARWGRWILLGLTVLAGAYALPLVWEAFRTLVRSPADFAGIDLQLRLRETNGWWAGRNVYETSGHAVYPPAAYLLFRPLFVFTEFEQARKVWALWLLVLAGVASWGCVRAAGLRTWQGTVFAALLPLTLMGTYDGIRIGQVSLLCIVAGCGAVLLLTRRDAGWGTDLAAAALFLVALSKPSMIAPFFWLVCFVPRRWRPAALVVAGYALLTVVSTQLVDDEPLLLLLARWTDRAVQGARFGALDGGRVNLQTALGVNHLDSHAPVVALVLFGGLAAWLAGRPTRDPWILLGVTGIVARLAIYHRNYDDLLVLPALVALVRLAARPPGARLGTAATVVFGASWLVMVVPGRGRFNPDLHELATWVCWLASASVLVWAAHTSRPIDDGDAAA